MIDPDFYTTQHIELEVAELDIDEGLKDVILATLERYEHLKAKIAEIEKQDPVKGTYWREGSGVFTNSPRDTDERLYLRPSPAISKMETTGRITEQDARKIADTVIRYCNTRNNVSWSTDTYMKEVGGTLLANLNKQGA